MFSLYYILGEGVVLLFLESSRAASSRVMPIHERITISVACSNMFKNDVMPVFQSWLSRTCLMS